MCFKTFLNHPINQKTSRKKKPKAITVLKKEGGGVRRGMIMITDSMGFFFMASLSPKVFCAFLHLCLFLLSMAFLDL